MKSCEPGLGGRPAGAEAPSRRVGALPAAQGSLLRDLPDATAAEHSAPLAAWPGTRLERIVSRGQASPPGFWYDQEEDEWVALIAGAARLEIDGEATARQLAPGDWVLLPAHRRHRVAWTDEHTDTVWLALFVR